jgi:hypothetical protein
MKCLNTSNPEVKNLLDYFKSEVLVAKVLDTIDYAPSIDEFKVLLDNMSNSNTTTSADTTIKEGVPELFEQNPELANAVYAAIVPKGYTRLYRAENEKGVDSPAPDWVKENEQVKQSQEATGRWFYKTLEEAKYHAEKFGGTISFVDVITSDVENYNARDNKFAGGYGREGNEYFVSKEIATKRQDFEQQKQQAQQLYSQYLESLNKPNTNPILQGNQEAVITPNDKIVFGHPGIGKTFLRESGRTDVIDFDSDYKSRINEKFGLEKGFKARNDFQKNNKEEYQKVVRDLWIEAKKEASETGKQLFASDMILLREFANDFDKVITMSKETFISRAKQRNDYTPGIEGTEGWKQSLDTAISNVDKSKVVSTDKYLSDLFSNTQQEQVKKFTELQERLNNKEFLEGAKNAFESSEELQNVYYEAAGLRTLENNKLEQDIKELIKGRENIPSSIFLSYLVNNNLIPKIQEYITSIGYRGGEWHPLYNRLTLNYATTQTSSEKAKLIAHELMHSLSHKYITTYEALKNKEFKNYIEKTNENEKLKGTGRQIELTNLTEEQVKAFDNLVRIKQKVYDFIKKGEYKLNENLLKADFGSLNYAFSDLDKKEDIHEFISEAFSNPILIDVLKQIPTEGNKSNLFKEFIKALKIILGFNNESIIEDILYYSEKAFINEALKESNNKKQDALNVYTDYIARVSLGIVKNPTSGEYNYESKVKDIVYHYTDAKKFDKFVKDYIGSSVEKTGVNAADSELGIFFGKKGLEGVVNKEKLGTTEIPALINIKNPNNDIYDKADEYLYSSERFIDEQEPDYDIELEEDENGNIKTVYKEKDKLKGKDLERAWYNSYKKDLIAQKKDGVVLDRIKIVFEPEQIHILSSKADIQGFKDFVNSNSTKSNISFDISDVNQVEYSFKAADIISKNINKIKQWENNKSISQDLLFNKIQELGIPKEQIELLKISKGSSIEEKLIDFTTNYSYTVEINTAKVKDLSQFNQDYNEHTRVFEYNGFEYRLDDYYAEELGIFYEKAPLNNLNNSIAITEQEFNQAANNAGKKEEKPTQYYYNLTVPGGTNYTEQEISTPLITPSIKGHAQFATDNGIGWFRSDEQLNNQKDLEFAKNEWSKEDYENYLDESKTKTRRILEVQSDLFQKWRNNFEFQGNTYTAKKDDKNVWHYYKNGSEINANEYTKTWETFLDTYLDNADAFTKLLQKDNNWVTFFIKSIIQDSAKKGYEKVLFPSGDTASKVEGHTTLEEFKKQKKDRIKELEKQEIDNKSKIGTKRKTSLGEYIYNEENYKQDKENINVEITQLKQELERVETEGFGALRPIWNFYENTVTNILKKQGYNPVLITDEYGNTWNGVNIEVLPESKITSISFDISLPEESEAEAMIAYAEKYKASRISFSINNTDNMAIDNKTTKEILDNLKTRLGKVYANYNNATDPAKKYQLEKRIEELKANIEALTSEGKVTRSKVKTMALKELEVIKKRIADNPEAFTYSELVDIFRALTFWSDTKNMLYEVSTDSDEDIKEITTVSKDLLAKTGEALKAYLVSDMNNKGYQASLSDLERIIQGSAVRTTINTIGKDINKVTQYLDETIRMSQQQAKANATRKLREFERLIDGLTDEQLDLLMQRDAEGNPTFGLTNRYSQEWYDEISSLYAMYRGSFDDNGKIKNKANFDKYFDFLKTNTVVVDSTLFLKDSNGNYLESEASREKEYRRIKEAVGTGVDELIDESIDKYNLYLKELENIKEYYEVVRLNEGFTVEERDRMILKWQSQHDPASYMMQLTEKTTPYGSDVVPSSRFVLTSPRRFVGGQQTKWFDSKFDSIRSNPKLWQTYQFIEKQMSELKDVLPGWQKVPTNFLFNVSKKTVETMVSNGLKGVLPYLKDKSLETLTVSYADLVPDKRVDTLTGEPMEYIDMPFVNTARNISKSIKSRLDEEMSTKEKNLIARRALKDSFSTNIREIMEAGIAAAEKYKQIVAIESKAILINKVIQDAAEVKLDSQGNPIPAPTSWVTSKSGAVTIKQSAKYAVDAALYGKTKKEEGSTKMVFGSTKEVKEARAGLRKQIYDLKYQFEQGNIKESDYKKQLKSLQDKLDKVNKEDEKGKSTSMSKSGDALIKLTQITLLGWSPFSAINEVGFGFLSNIIHASGEQDFTSNDAIKAFGIMLSTYKKLKIGQPTELDRKITSALDLFGIVGRANDNDHGSDTKSKWSALNPFALLRSADFFNKGMTTVSILIHEKLENGNSLYDVLLPDGEFDRAKMTSADIEKWIGNENEDTSAYSKLRNKIKVVNERIHNYEPSTTIPLKRTVLGRLVAQFKLSWMANGIDNRWGPEYYDNQLEREVKGRYRSYATVYQQEGGFLSTITYVLKNLMLKTVRSKMQLGELTKVDEANMKRNIAELQIVLGIMMVIAILKNLAEGDDDDDVYKLIANTFIRLRNDTLLYANPGIFQDITRSFIPAISYLDNVTKVITGTYKYITDEDYQTEDYIKRVTKVFPIANNYNRFEWLREQYR